MDDAARITALLRFWTMAIELKRLRRQGWLDRGVVEPESAADHSWAVALLAWLLARELPELNRHRVLLLGLLHDLPEAIAGDATPFDEARGSSGTIDPARFRVAPEYTDAERLAKQESEASALDQMLSGVEPEFAVEIRDVWREYAGGTTAESRFVRQVDKLETLLQAESYLTRQPDLVVDSFWLGARRDVIDPHLVRLIEALEQAGARPYPPDDRRTD
jgi:putative hydrolase of HD superfamily